MKTVSRILAVISALMALCVMAFYPVIWNKYEQITGINLTNHSGGLGLFLVLIILPIGFVVLSIYLFNYQDTKNK